MKTLILILCFGSLQAQVFEKHDLVSLPVSFLSGAMYGYTQVYAFHYDNFKQVHPNANDQWFNQDLSSNNKYKNGDPAQGPKFWGSTNIFVWTTDAYHREMMLSRGLMFGATIPLFGWEPDNFLQVIWQFVKLSMSYVGGFHLVWGVVYNVMQLCVRLTLGS